MQRNQAAEVMMAAETSNQAGQFKIRNLSVLAYANGFTLWHYKAGKDTLHNASALGYFNDACDMMAVGDMIFVSACDGGGIRMVVTSEASGVITSGLG